MISKREMTYSNLIPLFCLAAKRIFPTTKEINPLIRVRIEDYRKSFMQLQSRKAFVIQVLKFLHQTVVKPTHSPQPRDNFF